MTVKKLIINEDNSGRRIDNYLLSIFNSLPRSKIYNIIRKGEVRVNSSRIKPSYRLKVGDLIRIPPNIDFIKASSKKIDKKLIDKHAHDILFENKNYIITNKQNNISVHSGTKNFIGLIDIFRKKYGANIDLCHRLDKTTSGCLVFGKNKKAVKSFNNLLIDNNITKTYHTILKGKLKKNITIDKPIYKNIPTKFKNSISKFKIIKYLSNATLVEVQIYTGRTHQIRIHSASINHPIIFDDRYGDKDFNNSFDNNVRKKIALHSKSISFIDLDSKIICVECNPPNEFNSLVEMLK